MSGNDEKGKPISDDACARVFYAAMGNVAKTPQGAALLTATVAPSRVFYGAMKALEKDGGSEWTNSFTAVHELYHGGGSASCKLLIEKGTQLFNEAVQSERGHNGGKGR